MIICYTIALFYDPILQMSGFPLSSLLLQKLVNTETKNVDKKVVVLSLALLLLLVVLVALVVALVLLLLVMRLLLRSGLLVHLSRLLGSIGQLNYHDSRVLGVDVMTQSVLVAQLLNGRLNLSHSSRRMKTLSYNGLDNRITSLHGCLDSLSQKLLGFFHIQTVEIDLVVGGVCVVFSENVLGSLSVVLVHLFTVLLCLLTQLLGSSAVSALVGLLTLL